MNRVNWVDPTKNMSTHEPTNNSIQIEKLKKKKKTKMTVEFNLFTIYDFFEDLFTLFFSA